MLIAIVIIFIINIILYVFAFSYYVCVVLFCSVFCVSFALRAFISVIFTLNNKQVTIDVKENNKIYIIMNSCFKML